MFLIKCSLLVQWYQVAQVQIFAVHWKTKGMISFFFLKQNTSRLFKAHTQYNTPDSAEVKSIILECFTSTIFSKSELFSTKQLNSSVILVINIITYFSLVIKGHDLTVFSNKCYEKHTSWRNKIHFTSRKICGKKVCSLIRDIIREMCHFPSWYICNPPVAGPIYQTVKLTAAPLCPSPHPYTHHH